MVLGSFPGQVTFVHSSCRFVKCFLLTKWCDGCWGHNEAMVAALEELVVRAETGGGVMINGN